MDRYLLLQPRDLESLAITKLARWVALRAEEIVASASLKGLGRICLVLSEQIEIVGNYLQDNVPRTFHDKLVAEIVLAFQKTDGSRRRNAACDTTAMCRMMGKLTGVTRLKIKDIDEMHVIQLIGIFNNLKHLALPRCPINVLRCIVNDCKLLETLHIDGEYFGLVDMTMDLLRELKHLRSIVLGRASTNAKGIERILLSCENIEHIGTGYANITAEALASIVCSGERAGKRFRLKTYSANGNTLEQLQLVVEVCPLIENLTLLYKCVRSNFMTLVGFKNLRELTLGWCHFYDDHVYELLEHVGYNLVHLDLHCDSVNLNALMDISQTCPNLQSFSPNISGYMNPSSSETELKIPPFRNLKKITLNLLFLRFSSSAPSLDEPILFLLSNSLNVEFLVFDKSFHISEDLMLKVMDANPFISLRELLVRTDNRAAQKSDIITAEVVGRFMRSPVSRPAVLVRTERVRSCIR